MWEWNDRLRMFAKLLVGERHCVGNWISIWNVRKAEILFSSIYDRSFIHSIHFKTKYHVIYFSNAAGDRKESNPRWIIDPRTVTLCTFEEPFCVHFLLLLHFTSEGKCKVCSSAFAFTLQIKAVNSTPYKRMKHCACVFLKEEKQVGDLPHWHRGARNHLVTW